MGFALPLLSLTRFALQAHRHAAVRENLASQASSQAPARPARSQPRGAMLSNSPSEDTRARPAVFTMRRSRSRRRATAPAVPSAQMPLPLEAAPACSQPRMLRIVQREPRNQPECLLISGRMADVCAALERMAANEGALHA